MHTLELFPSPVEADAAQQREVDRGEFRLDSYDYYIVAFSGGKDSLACLLWLLKAGVDKSRIELWHHDIDGHGEKTFFDWEITPDYCRKIAAHFGLPIYFSWRQGGLKREMLRENQRTAPVFFQTPDGKTRSAGGEGGKLSTRRKFPQVSADLSVRWCSGVLKSDTCTTAITNQERFNHKRTMLITGERAEESKARSNYATFEPDRADNRYQKPYTLLTHHVSPKGKKFTTSRLVEPGKNDRHVDRFRPIHSYTEQQVWDLIAEFKVRAHPAYYLGWGRASCKFCIFQNANGFKSAATLSPEQAEEICQLEEAFGVTIKRKESMRELLAKGTPYPALRDAFTATLAVSKEYTLPVYNPNWTLPAGAFSKESCGPS